MFHYNCLDCQMSWTSAMSENCCSSCKSTNILVNTSQSFPMVTIGGHRIAPILNYKIKIDWDPDQRSMKAEFGKCTNCGAALRALLRTTYCPNDCDKKEIA